MVFKEIGIYSIAEQSETIMMPDNLFLNIKNFYPNIYTLFEY